MTNLENVVDHVLAKLVVELASFLLEGAFMNGVFLRISA
jgi:hypothetical protein